ncbi:MAG: rod shape-determining protein MreC [Candidatus Parcubacteria bacterium]|jgi:cell shape-determining protein MreC
MKMISRQRSNVKRKLLTICIVGGVAVLLLNLPLPFLGNMLAPVDSELATLERGGLSVGAWIRARFTATDTLTKELADTKAALAEKAAALTTLRDSLPPQVVQDILDARSGEARIAAAILSSPSDTPYDTLVVDRGTQDGVKEGAVVYGASGAPLGTIVRAHNNTSVVVLFSTPGTITSLYAPREKILAKATGIGGGVFSLLMPHGSSVKEGDIVTMPTLGGEPVGTVSRVWSDPAEPGVIAAITHNDALRSLHTVSIAKEPFVMPSTNDIKASMERFASTTEMLFAVPDGLASTTASGTRSSL